MDEAVTHESAPPPDIPAILRVRAEQELARQAEVPDLDQVQLDHAEQALEKVAATPDEEQVLRDWEEERLRRQAPEARESERIERELQEHRDLIAKIRAEEQAAMAAQLEGSD